MNYWELREVVKKLAARKTQFLPANSLTYLNEKGRKVNYRQFDLVSGEMKVFQRLLNKDYINSFLEISLRAAHCPMPFNADVWDGSLCAYGCRYCWADILRYKLYTAFFDNGKDIGYRSCKPEFFQSELDNLMRFRGRSSEGLNDKEKAFALEIPLRFGIRFEDFLPVEGVKKVSLAMLKYLADVEYPVMINTKSDLLAREDYLKELVRNKGKAAVHITMISSDSGLLKELEPGAPSFEKRIAAAKALVQAGIRVVARIEPFMAFINDRKEDVEDYVGQLRAAGVEHITLDTYSYSAKDTGIRRNFESVGWDFERMFTLMSDCQWLGSLLLGKFMEYLRSEGFSCSTFDFGNVPSNDQMICCEVGDWFKGFSYGNTTMAIRYIASQEGRPVTWGQYEAMVNGKGGFLSESLRNDVHHAWNTRGNAAYFPDWAAGIEPCGVDSTGNRIWRYNNKEDFRQDMLRRVI